MKKSTKKIIWMVTIFALIMLIIRWVGIYYFNWFSINPYGHMLMGWTMPFGVLGMAVFWIFVILILFSVIDYKSERNSEHANRTLNERLSKGEIDIEEYERILKKIKENEK
ncbi:MAG: hypothetical protein ABH890_05190 [Bacillota bacterium]